MRASCKKRTPFKMICLSAVEGAEALSSLGAPRPVVALFKCFLPSWINWQRGIRLARLSSLSREHAFWSMFSVSENQVYLCSGCSYAIQLCREINSSKDQNPPSIAEVSFTFKQLSTVLTSVTQRKKKETIDKTFTPNEAAQEWHRLAAGLVCACVCVSHGGLWTRPVVGSRPITLAAHQVHMIRNHSLDPGRQKGSSIEEPDGFAAGPMFAALTFSMSDTMSKKKQTKKKNHVNRRASNWSFLYWSLSALIDHGVHLSDPNLRGASSHTVSIDYRVQISNRAFRRRHAAEMGISERLRLTAGLCPHMGPPRES